MSDERMTMQIPDGSVVITPSQMYHELQAVHRTVDDLSRKLDPALTGMQTQQNDHEIRIRALESRKYVPPAAVWTLVGIAIAALSVLATVLGSVR